MNIEGSACGVHRTEEFYNDPITHLFNDPTTLRLDRWMNDLVAQLTVMCADRADPRKARRYALLLGEGQKYPRLMQRYKETVIGPRHDAMREVIRRGIASGELRANTDVEIALLALTGTVLAKEKAADGSLNGEFAARIVDELLLGLAAR